MTDLNNLHLRAKVERVEGNRIVLKPAEWEAGRTRDKNELLPEGDITFTALGTDVVQNIKPGDEFLVQLIPATAAVGTERGYGAGSAAGGTEGTRDAGAGRPYSPGM